MPTYSALAPSMRGLVKRLKLRRCRADQLTISRQRNGEGGPIHSSATDTDEAGAALSSLAVPPAYEHAYYAADERAHLQAVGRDAAGRLQYRYHPDWEKVREAGKAQRLGALVEVLPKIRRTVTQHLGVSEPSRVFALAAITELVSGSAIRPGGEEYTKKHGSRGATTLLKSNVRVGDDMITLVFRGKSGKDVRKEFKSPRLASAIEVLKKLPGRRLFQYRDDEGSIRRQRARVKYSCAESRLQHSAQDFRHAVQHRLRCSSTCRASCGKRELGRARSVKRWLLEAEEIANTPGCAAAAMFMMRCGHSKEVLRICPTLNPAGRQRGARNSWLSVTRRRLNAIRSRGCARDRHPTGNGEAV